MTAHQFLDELSRQQLVPQAVLQSLQRQVSTAGKPIPADAIAKLLVDKGQLTVQQARGLLASNRMASMQRAGTASVDGLLPLNDVEPLNDLQPLDNVELLDDLEPLGDAGLAPLVDADLAALPSEGDLAQPSGLGDTALAAPAATTTAPVAAGQHQAAPAGKSGLIVAAVAGVVLLGLIVAGVALISLSRGDGEAEFEQALSAYEAQQYNEAAEGFKLYLANYASGSRADEARVRLAMARILLAKQRGATSAALLPVAEEALADVAAVSDLTAVEAELAPLLSDLAIDLVRQAQDSRSMDEAAERMDIARRAIELAGNGRYVPGMLRPWQRLADAEESLALLDFRAGREIRIAAALSAIEQALNASDATVARAQWEGLLRMESDLRDDPRLARLGSRLAEIDALGIQPVANARAMETGEAATPVRATVCFASRVAEADAAVRPGFAVTGGTVWALDAATGGVLWRRATGSNSGVAIASPSSELERDCVLVDANRHEVVRVAGTGGTARWRYPLDSPGAGTPLAVGNRIIVATRAGHVIALDARSGERLAEVALPYSIRVGAALGPGSSSLLIVADRLHLFTLDATSLQCRGGVYLGHEAGSVVAAPTIADNLILVAENTTPDLCRLHIVPIDDERMSRQGNRQIELAGNVLTPPVADGDRFYVATDRGLVYVMERTGDPASPLREANRLPLSNDRRVIHFPVVLDGALWLAGNGLRSFRAAPDGELQEQASLFDGATLLGAPQIVGGSLMCVRREAGRQETVVSAVQANGRVQWETRLAASFVAGPVLDDAAGASVLTSLGTHAQVPLDGLTGDRLVGTSPADGQQEAPLPPLAGSVELADGRHVLVPLDTTREMYLADASRGELRKMLLPASRAGLPIGWSNGVLIAGSNGTVWLLDARSGAPLAGPLQLSMASGKRLETCALAAASDDAPSFVVADGGTNLYEVGLEPQPQPQLVVRSQARLPQRFAGSLAALDDLVIAVDAAGTVHRFALPGLEPRGQWDLGSSGIVYGPQRVGNVVLVLTASGELLCFDGGNARRWTQSFRADALAGKPIVQGETLILTTPHGALHGLSLVTGEELVRLDLGQALAGTPRAITGALLVPTADGSLLKLALPTPEPTP